MQLHATKCCCCPADMFNANITFYDSICPGTRDIIVKLNDRHFENLSKKKNQKKVELDRFISDYELIQV